MADHSRRNSRGSFSLFSDTIRSLSRAGSRRVRLHDENENEPSLRSQSSLSCDPNRQLVSPEPLDATDIMPPAKAARSSSGCGSALLRRSNTSPIPQSVQKAGKKIAAIDFSSHERKLNKSRPRSWLSLARPSGSRQNARSKSLQLPKDNSTSTLARSVISSPVLQSTTNSDVAKAEGVRCGELSDVDFSQSSWDSQIGWVPRRPHPPDAATSKARPGILPSKIEQKLNADNGHKHTETNQEISRSWTKNRLVQLGSNLTNKIKGSQHASKLSSSLNRQQFSRLTDERKTALKVDQRIVRRKQETLNLCRDKIKSLTGHGYVKRKSLQNDECMEFQAKEKEQQRLLGNEMDTEIGKAELGDRASDKGMGSLTRSFASAVDKLDFYSSRNSQNETFSQAKTSVADAIRPACRAVQQETPSLGKHHSAQIVPPKQQDLVPVTFNSTSHTDASIQFSSDETCAFSKERNGLVSQLDRAPAHYTLGVNALGCHSNVMDFAEPPTDTWSERTQNQVHPSPDIGVYLEDEEDDLLDDLEDAPIFSPSLGDLSQYSRKTPSSKSTTPHCPKLDGLDAVSLHHRTIQYDTPTRPPGKGADGRHRKPRLKKSLSSLGLFRKSHSEKTMMTTTEQERARHGQAVGPYLGSALRTRDENQKICGERKEGRKSKSMVFGVRGSYNSSSADSAISPALRRAYQPPTPSPLRQANTVKHTAMPSRGSDEMGILVRPFDQRGHLPLLYQQEGAMTRK